MSLSVYVFAPGAGDRMEVLDTPPGSGDAAGFENWRRTVWGSDAVRKLGCRLFPVLATDDLTVAPAEVEEFLQECAMIRANLDVVAPHPNPYRPKDEHVDTMNAVSARLANIEAAAARARASGCGVIIW
ncbi:hypothetical protein [Actinophytocola sp.]|uniref:hypothetical protein n=1 Tax=Actinophytocola sp. TaxID=1872138 RepID=UPI00389A3C07